MATIVVSGLLDNEMWLSALVILTVTVQSASGCGAGGIGGVTADDNRIVQNPTLDMELSPPVAWTYPDPNSEAFGSFFPGQSLLQSDANIKAMSDIEAAVISALVDSKISTQGVSVRSSYQAPEINDCRKVSMATPKGTNIGIVEANAVVKLLTPAVDITIADCPNRNFYSTPTTPPTVQDFSIRAAVTIQGVTASKYQIRQIARSMMVTLNFRNSVRFISEIKVKN